MKEFADDNFKFNENGRKLSKRVENTVGKGDTARYEQYLLFPQCFQKACFPGASKGVIVWEWVNTLPNDNILALTKFKAFANDKFTVAKMKISILDRIENIVGNGEKAGNTSIFSFSHNFFESSFTKP